MGLKSQQEPQQEGQPAYRSVRREGFVLRAKENTHGFLFKRSSDCCVGSRRL